MVRGHLGQSVYINWKVNKSKQEWEEESIVDFHIHKITFVVIAMCGICTHLCECIESVYYREVKSGDQETIILYLVF